MSDYVKLMLRYKNQITILLSLLLSLFMFIVGRVSVNVPPKSVVCANELITIDKQFNQIQKKDAECAENVLNAVDKEKKSCEKNIRDNVNSFKDSNEALDCRICKSLSIQCESKGQW
jgi:hypothetical protein